MKKNNRGFTLVELLAVIVILGLLMAIAIPSVTKYITQSRVKTLISSMDSYVTAVVTSVNDGEYKFSDSTKVFAIPIECISLEKGGKNPFGNWYQANEAYWAYVLVHYDNVNYNYEYGFTFKDDAGYGMYPTLNDKIENQMVRTGYDDLNQPRDGYAVNFVSIDRWEGFSNINTSTKLVVLEAESEGITGNGKDTCTLCQKGDNYDDVEDGKVEYIKDRTLVTTYDSNTSSFWGYKEQIKIINFESSINIPANAYKSWDVSVTGNGKVMAYIKTNSSNSSYYDLYIQGDEQLFANSDSSYLFYNFRNVDKINNIEILNVSKVTSMSNMFRELGRLSTIFTLDLGDNFDTRNVTNMFGMFCNAGYSSPVFTLDLGSKFDTSNVTNMSTMFYGTGINSRLFKLDLGSNFNTSKVTTMYEMFAATGRNCPVFSINFGNKFDTSNVTNMGGMFNLTGESSSSFYVDCRSWNVNKVTVYVPFNNNVGHKVIPPVWVN